MELPLISPLLRPDGASRYDLRNTSEPVVTKWYLDCVDGAGDLAIAYCARLAWMHVSVSYSSVIINRRGMTRSREQVTKTAAPAIDGDHLAWEAPGLGLHAELQRRVEAYGETLLDGVEWRCVMPSATALFHFDDEPPMRGCGYAEILQMHVAPWKLPLDELRWGRRPQDDDITFVVVRVKDA